jgi:BlaI family transcriptional regulator, penicillinase repressor
MKLSGAEEVLMNHLWRLKKAYLKDLLEAYPDPKPAPTTTSTLLNRMQKKKFVDYDSKGKSRLYFPLVSKENYCVTHIQELIKNFFDGSPARFAYFFAQQINLSPKELEELKSIIEDRIQEI